MVCLSDCSCREGVTAQTDWKNTHSEAEHAIKEDLAYTGRQRVLSAESVLARASAPVNKRKGRRPLLSVFIKLLSVFIKQMCS